LYSKYERNGKETLFAYLNNEGKVVK
jgi:hypothetical protein